MVKDISYTAIYYFALAGTEYRYSYFVHVWPGCMTKVRNSDIRRGKACSSLSGVKSPISNSVIICIHFNSIKYHTKAEFQSSASSIIHDYI